MFTEQVEKLEILVAEFAKIPGLNGRLIVDTFKDTIGQCRSDLRHNGRVEISTTRGNLPDTTDAILTAFDDATLTINRHANKPSDCNDWPPKNGWGLNIGEGGLKVCGPLAGPFGWAKATANWTNVAGDNSTVAANIATDRTGTLAIPYRSKTIYLPRWGTGFDPGIYTNSVFPFYLDRNGALVCPLTPSSLIGELKTWNSASSIPTGWQLADGTNGTIDMRDALAGGYKSGGTYGTIGGSFGNGSAAIGGSLTVDSATTGISGTNNGTTGLSLASHTITFGTRFTGSTTTPETSYPAFDSITSTNPHNHTITEPNSGAGHSHTITDGGHAHTTSGSTLTAPLTKALVWIQRVT